jgi:hypothetical protein
MHTSSVAHLTEPARQEVVRLVRRKRRRSNLKLFAQNAIGTNFKRRSS